jgi:hypothetical protein
MLFLNIVCLTVAFANNNVASFFCQERNKFDLCCCCGLNEPSLGRELGSESFLYKFFKNCYSPFLLSEWIRPSIIVIFIGWLCASVGRFRC